MLVGGRIPTLLVPDLDYTDRSGQGQVDIDTGNGGGVSAESGVASRFGLALSSDDDLSSAALSSHVSKIRTNLQRLES